MLACLVRWANGVKMGNYELQPTSVRTVLLGNDFDNIQVCSLARYEVIICDSESRNSIFDR